MANYDQLVNKNGTIYNTAANVAYPNADQLALDLGVPVNQINFGAIKSDPNYTPPAQSGNPLTAIKQDLNDYQNKLFTDSTQPPQRQSSTIDQQITDANAQTTDALSKYDELTKKLEGMQPPNSHQNFLDARIQAGVPALEGEYNDITTQRNDQPYVTRAQTGNAGIATEGQLQETTAQKDIPLYVQQQNLIDRLKLANDFVNTAVQLKDSDYNKSVDAITKAASLIGDSIGLATSHLNTLTDMQKTQQTQQQAAQQFAFENNISKPFYEIGGTVFRTSDRTPAHNAEEYIKMGGKGDFSDVQHVDALAPQEQKLVSALAQKYPDAGIQMSDSYVAAMAKLQNSKIYQQETRLASRGGGSPSPSKPASDKVTVTEGTNLADQYLQQKRGHDGYVSPQDFQAARQAWVDDGLDVNTFYARFKKYINPDHPQDY